MGKIKLNKRDNYTIISNHVLKNENLSLKAKGLFAYMWSLPDNWEYSVAGLEKVLKEGKSAINEALKELEKEGYLVRTILRKEGKFSDMDYILHEFPQRSPFTDFPQAENPFTENQLQINKDRTKKEIKENPLPLVKGEQAPSSTSTSYSEVFNASENKDIKDALVRFVNVCRGRNIKFQYKTLERWAKILRDNAGSDSKLAMAMVEQSIDNGWKDIYPLKNTGKTAYVKKEAVSVPVSKEDKARNPDGSYVAY